MAENKRHKGHRQRMRERVQSYGLDSLAEGIAPNINDNWNISLLSIMTACFKRCTIGQSKL